MITEFKTIVYLANLSQIMFTKPLGGIDYAHYQTKKLAKISQIVILGVKS